MLWIQSKGTFFSHKLLKDVVQPCIGLQPCHRPTTVLSQIPHTLPKPFTNPPQTLQRACVIAPLFLQQLHHA